MDNGPDGARYADLQGALGGAFRELVVGVRQRGRLLRMGVHASTPSSGSLQRGPRPPSSTVLARGRPLQVLDDVLVATLVEKSLRRRGPLPGARKNEPENSRSFTER
mmetsp:Transcript_106463/g.227339  ORF Transcript_106463/g.227339 Transcript_106463/m.227339 type:complete len:107 (+) Transcript_106463:252-572(+)